MNRTIKYTTPARYEDEATPGRRALAVITYEHSAPMAIVFEVLCEGASLKFAVPRKTALIALDRPLLTPNFAFGRDTLDLRPAVTIAFRGGSSRKVTLTRDSLSVFLARTQIMVPVDEEWRVPL